MSVIQQEQITRKLTKYLVGLTQLQGNCMTKLAAFTIIQEFLKNDKNQNIRQLFIEFGLMDSILITIDDGIDNPSDLAFVDVSLKCLWALSQLPIGPLQMLINKNVIKRLVNLLDTSSSVFIYKPDFTSRFKTLCEKKHLVGKLKDTPMTSDLFNRIQKLSNGKLKIFESLPDCLKCCHLYDTSESDTDIDVSELLVSEGKAWLCSEVQADDNTKDTEELWVDIFITEVIDGPLFWGHVGISVIENVRKIQASLATHHASQDFQPIKCDVGEMVSVCTKLDDDSLFYVRAVVLVTGIRRIKAWSLDYGFLMDLPNNQVFMLPKELQTTVYPPQVSLCSLAGIQAPPRSPLLTKFSASILTNLSKKSVPVCEIIHSLGGLEIIQRFLEECPDPDTWEFIFNLINNIACQSKMADSITESRFIEIVLGKLVALSTLPEKTKMNPLLAGLGCLCNLLYKNEFTRNQFYQLQGIELILKIMMMHAELKDDVYKMGTKVLRMFIQGFHKYPTDGYKSSKTNVIQTRQRNIHHRPAALRNCPIEFAKLLEDHRNEQTKNKSATMTDEGRAIMSQARQYEEAWSSDDSSDESLHAKYKSSVVQVLSTSLNSDDETDAEPIMKKKISKESPRVTKDMAEFYSNTQGKFYILNAEVDVVNDTTHELRPNKSIEKVSSLIISKHTCGMLNSGKGGSIYFGFQAVVQGVKLNREDRDEFRLGVDKMMCDKICPCVLHSMFDVLYHPVMEKDENGALTLVENSFIAEITIKPNHGTFYNLKDGDCYYRYGAHTSKLSAQEMRQLIILEDEEMYREEIQDLRQELEELKHNVENSKSDLAT